MLVTYPVDTLVTKLMQANYNRPDITLPTIAINKTKNGLGIVGQFKIGPWNIRESAHKEVELQLKFPAVSTLCI